MAKGKTASGIMVYCAHKAIIKTSELIPNPRNPNTHRMDQVELLAKIIKTQGWRNPIVVSDLSGCIVKGHCRLKAACLLGLDTVPVDVQHYDNEADEMADMVADNRIAELADMDNGTLKDILQDLDTGAFDLDLTGYDVDALEQLMEECPPEPEENDSDGSGMVKCPKCGNVFEA